MKGRVGETRRWKRGQTMTEYVIVFAALIGVVMATVGLATAARRAAARDTQFVASPYP